MRTPTRDEQRTLVRLWDSTGRELEQMRRDGLRGIEYNWRHVDALLALGDSYSGPPRTTSGLVEMQYWFVKAARKP